ncbi:hypothetical protein [Roseofilum casamattae]|uniref:Nif11-like leader peptide family natural product n=1 Tax=Roseofilum casamattae BLCC-M143 TaxID=3022442 RepID=A0ABT7C1G9_9CYAN|nr:hypothetical protein [Roseofilum casamattae]MDJ1184358.1 hypothetical protein [Roseofilum casamattae BLCC-M143]
MPLESLVEKIAASTEWQEKIENCESEEQAVALVKEAASSLGESITDAEIQQFLEDLSDEEMDDEDLAAAAGGAHTIRRGARRGWRGTTRGARRYFR